MLMHVILVSGSNKLLLTGPTFMNYEHSCESLTKKKKKNTTELLKTLTTILFISNYFNYIIHNYEYLTLTTFTNEYLTLTTFTDAFYDIFLRIFYF